MEKQINPNELNAEAFIRATEMLRVMFPHFSDGWIKLCQDRILDVEYIGVERGAEVFHVHRNPKFDGESKSEKGKGWKYRKVLLRNNPRASWCSCFYGPWSRKRQRQLCSHIGACFLWKFYFQVLDKLEQRQ